MKALYNLKRLILLALLITGCSHASQPTGGILAPLPGGGSHPDVSQTGAVNGWVTIALSEPAEFNQNITVGHDGAFWGPWGTGTYITRTDVYGNQTNYPMLQPSYFYSPRIAANPDGNVYVSERDSSDDDWIAQVTPQGRVTDFPLPGVALGGTVTEIISASDGSLWMLRNAYNGFILAKMTTTGVYTTLDGPAEFVNLVRGPDKNVWCFGSEGLDRISVLDGTITTFPFPQSKNGVEGSDISHTPPAGLVEGSDGHLWDAGGDGLYRIDMAGNTTFYPVRPVHSLTAGPNHKLYWVVEKTISEFDELTGTRTRKIAGFGSPLIVGSDNQLWLLTPTTAYVYILHPIVVTPSSVTVGAGSSTSISVVEQQSHQTVFGAVSNNPNVATVSGSRKNFTVTGVAPGNTTITVSDKIGNSLDVPVTVQ